MQFQLFIGQKIYYVLELLAAGVFPLSSVPKNTKQQSVLESEFGYILSVKKLGRANAYAVYFQNETNTPDHILLEVVKV